ncbi:unnamed protein product [Prunus armeniaca]|uniref:Uncharacterized protein n=1 Tax=Prunus armeniaca TaxID=36596 RepID=A0A6J5TY58_PRUAR|nr:unnamed protein product [Prunus armeniaca]
MEDLEKRFGSHLRLSARERGGIRIEAGDGINLMRGSRFSLVARVLTSKAVFSDGFVGKFLIRFASRRDMLRVLDMEPWSYKEHLVLLSEIQLGKEVREVEASMASFWVQMHGVPLLNMTMVVARKISSVLGQVLEVDHTEGEECIGRFLRVRIRLDVRQSLMRGSFVEFPEEGATWDQMMAFAGLEASEDLGGRRLRQHGRKESSDSSPWVSGDSTDGNMRRRKSYFTGNMREGSGGSKADYSDWRIRRGHTRGGYAEDSNLAGRIRATREAEERNRQIREAAWEAGILGPHGNIEVSPANSIEPHLPHGGVQTSVDSGIAIDLNAVAWVEERTTMQGTIHEALSNRVDVGGNLGGQSEALMYGSDSFNLGLLIFGQPVNSNTGGVGSRSKRGREENENGSMDKRRCASIRLVSACGGIGSMGSRREITFDDTLIQEAETGLESRRAL